jgi:cytochrome c oxidase assembly protein subunit 15
LTGFARLALGTTAVTYFLILVGGLVRASGAGLGCPDWPRCFGSWIPPASAAELPQEFDPAQFNPALMWTEYLNRLLGVAVGLLILATAVAAWRHHRREPKIVVSSVLAVLLTGFQGWLGGLVVAHELAAWIVTAHMLLALVIVSLLLYATVYAHYSSREVPRPRSRSGLQWTLALLIAVTLLQVALGTQVRGAVDAALAAGSPRTAALAAAGAMDAWHRDVALAVLGLALVVMLVVWSRHPRDTVIVRWTYATVAVALAQVLLGAAMAYMSLWPPVQVLHLTVASLLLGAETVMWLVARWEPREEETSEVGGRRSEVGGRRWEVERRSHAEAGPNGV